MINRPAPSGVESVNVSFGCVFEYTKVTDTRTILSLIDDLENEQKVSFSNPTDQIPNEHLYLTEDLFLSNESAKKLYLLLAEAFTRCVTHYKNWIEIKENLYPETFIIVKHLLDKKYDIKYDGSTRTNRAVSSVLYLNEGYQGGELDFPLQFHTYYPKSGSILTFPSNYAFEHITNPIKSGIKYEVLSFYHDCDSSINKDHLEKFKVIK